MNFDLMNILINLETTETAPGFIVDAITGIFATIDRVVFGILALMYEIFFMVATADILSNETIRNFYGRIQLILGIFMVFRLTISAITAIVSPDKISDKKQGFGNIIIKILTGLLLLVVITPINIPNPKNEFEIELNNNGLLFGTLYSFQYRILLNNTLGRLILGTEAPESSLDNPTDITESERISRSARIFTATLLKGFYRINLKPDTPENPRVPGGMTKRENWMCDDVPQEVIDKYSQIDVDTSLLLSYNFVNMTCNSHHSWFSFVSDTIEYFTSQNRYVFTYLIIAPTIVGGIFIFVLLGFTVDIAIRAIKLAVLRLIAPIPIIAYMAPDSKGNTAFSNWLSALVTTYIDLFSRLAIILFVTFLIQDMIVNGISLGSTEWSITGVLAMIFIWLGLFLFAKQAPKFLMDVLGIKGIGSNLGLASLIGGSAMIGGGLRSGIQGAKAAGKNPILGMLKGGAGAFAQGSMLGLKEGENAFASGKTPDFFGIMNKNRDLMAQIRTGDKDAKGGWDGQLQDRLNFFNRKMAATAAGYGDSNYVRAAQAVNDAKAAKKNAEDHYNSVLGKVNSAKDKLQAAKDASTVAYQNLSEKHSAYENIRKQEAEKLARIKAAAAEGKGLDGSTLTPEQAAKVVSDAERAYTSVVASSKSTLETARSEYARTTAEYKARTADYESFAVDLEPAKSALDDATSVLADAEKAKKTIDDARANFGISPRQYDKDNKTYRSDPEGVKSTRTDDDSFASSGRGSG